MAYNRNLYSSDTDALDAGIIYDQNELMMQDEINAAIKNGDLIVGQADNFASKMNQFSTGEFIERTTGGDASLSDGDGHLVLIRGNMVHTGYIAKSVNMTVTPIERDPSAGEFTAQIDDDLFLAEMQDTSGTMVFTYGSFGWDYEPSSYGITTDGLALPGDVISVTYQKEVRGTITQSDPQTFVSTGWNLYDHSKGYARALYYNNNPRFGITGTYTSVQYSLTITGAKSSVTPDANGTFGIPTDGNGGYIWVNGGNDTDTAVWMCWSDWTNDQAGKEPNGGVWEAYSESEIDLSTIMATYFVNGLMAVGSYQDEIDLSLGKVTANVGKMTYSEENLDDVIETGVEYDYDTSYIYYGLTEPIVSKISIDNIYAAYDHGIEFFTGTEVSIYTQTLYGVNLKNKLERDVVTISQQTLSASEQAQVATNLNVVKKSGDTMTGNLTINAGGPGVYAKTNYSSDSFDSGTSYNSIGFRCTDKNSNIVALYTDRYYKNSSDEFTGAYIAGAKKVNGSQVYNQLHLRVHADGTKSVYVTDPGAWRNAISAVNISGDTMTGTLWQKSNDFTIGTVPGTDKYVSMFGARDAAGNSYAGLYGTYLTTNQLGINIGAHRTVNGTTIWNWLGLLIDNNGKRVVTLSESAPWKEALSLGNLEVSVPTTANQNVSFKFTNKNTANSHYNHLMQLIPTDSGIFLYDSTLQSAVWSLGIPVSVANGGTGQSAVTTTTTISNIATKGTGIEITGASYSSWGRIGMIDLSFKATAAIANGAVICTIVSGKRPVQTLNATESATSALCTISSTGAVNMWTTKSSGATWSMRSIYLLL